MTQIFQTARYLKTHKSEAPAIVFFAMVISATFLF